MEPFYYSPCLSRLFADTKALAPRTNRTVLTLARQIAGNPRSRGLCRALLSLLEYAPVVDLQAHTRLVIGAILESNWVSSSLYQPDRSKDCHPERGNGYGIMSDREHREYDDGEGSLDPEQLYMKEYCIGSWRLDGAQKRPVR